MSRLITLVELRGFEPHGFLFQHHAEFATDVNSFLDGDLKT
jgi:hypothetical protein